jgi:hypothetical protein
MKKNHLLLGIIFLASAAAGYLAVSKMKQKKGCGCSGCNSKKDQDFKNATGRNSSQNCAVCKSAKTGDTYNPGDNRNCQTGDTCMSRYAFQKSLSLN